ncbi:MAG: glycosyltransferase N-terminal domain-containing protein, partial [Bacteroidota bacterium]|nr:glycosyltransferase N-terminal domain-containing protein [Bacteroidota bacterium]
MYILYSLFLFVFRILLGLLSLFDEKIRKGIEGRKGLFQILQTHYAGINPLRKRVIVHVSSFGELEQAKPVIAALKVRYPEIHIHLTFFSPSGYENAFGSYAAPDLVTYLPFDSHAEVRSFLEVTRPSLVVFVRYDLWHNFVREIHERNIPMILVSATFDNSLGKSLPFIKSLYRKTYSFVSTICAISEADKVALDSFAIHARDISVTGDTRCDQVIARRTAVGQKAEPLLPELLMEQIKREGTKIFVAGSTWRNDESVIGPVITTMISRKEKLITILAPHEVDRSHIDNLVSGFGASAILYSNIALYKDEKIIIVDSIGKLFAFYEYAMFAYVGGGFSNGVHNVLEPSVWGVPSIVGPNHKRSKEIAALIGLGGAIEVRDAEEFKDAFENWLLNDIPRTIASVATKEFV